MDRDGRACQCDQRAVPVEPIGCIELLQRNGHATLTIFGLGQPQQRAGIAGAGSARGQCLLSCQFGLASAQRDIGAGSTNNLERRIDLQSTRNGSVRIAQTILCQQADGQPGEQHGVVRTDRHSRIQRRHCLPHCAAFKQDVGERRIAQRPVRIDHDRALSILTRQIRLAFVQKANLRSLCECQGIIGVAD